MIQELISLAATVLTFVMFFPYIRSIHRGETKPHVFSWVIWGVGTLIVFFAQMAGHAGVGAWPIGISGLITCYIAVLSYSKRADIAITKSDWIFFSAALSALPFWFITSDPLWAVVTMTLVDLIAFGPTIRKGLRKPCEENVTFFALGGVRNFLVILALEHYSLTTVLFPFAIGLACIGFALLLVWRRHCLSK